MADQRPLYERDPDAWQAYLAEGNAKQARKRVGADVLLRNERGDVLLVDPDYKPDWDLPGGMVEANEAPQSAAERELHEELGLRRRVGRLLVVDWVAPHGPWDDSLMFVFDGGLLDAEPTPADGELRGSGFFPADRARTLLRPYLWSRLRHALDAAEDGCPRYLVDGMDQGSTSRG
ncbi:NUDIX domain-containing protein [Micromonospora rifamycinica]|uniref:ADP-ribose pyrophosphatase YjhB, NUDIX family n=1 Tax=Micromonospora rifamycinica TaxID=291594 RepID=A0A109IJA0_9ACTN|nr:NUDIX hydrolase [Micromonospora rifamycinica]KWV31591.1 NUDIX hydrolase [Micromonospora rifamycinica]SCG75909.1 ADP-ribose pyrophosphatase YjhB, NUDIX family [Micromonospora rifamycinica]